MTLEYISFPKPVKVPSRTSTITSSFCRAIVPTNQPTDKQKIAVFQKLNIPVGECAYCGDRASEFDHLRPLVKNKRPTGYINEIDNAIPSCGKCNQSKGGQDWKDWMLGNAKHSPKTRGISDLDKRVVAIETYEASTSPTVVDFESGADMEKYWAILGQINDLMYQAQVIADAHNQEKLRKQS